MKKFFALSALVLAGGIGMAASASEIERVPAIQDPVVLKECGACHMAFQPAFLSADAWKTMMGDLANHFGEDASLKPETAQHITDVLVAGAGRSEPGKLNISEQRWWQKEHRNLDQLLARYKAASASDCVTCHRQANQGLYEDD